MSKVSITDIQSLLIILPPLAPDIEWELEYQRQERELHQQQREMIPHYILWFCLCAGGWIISWFI